MHSARDPVSYPSHASVRDLATALYAGGAACVVFTYIAPYSRLGLSSSPNLMCNDSEGLACRAAKSSPLCLPPQNRDKPARILLISERHAARDPVVHCL